MKSLALLLILSSSALAVDTKLALQAKAAVANLPRGGIVIAEQNGSQAATFATAGQIEPAGVPPEKIVFEIGSISKVFTGLLLADEVLAGRMKLASTLRELLGPKFTFADPSVAAITLEQLATHTSGLPKVPDDVRDGGNPADPYAHYDRTRLDAWLSKAKLDHAPPFPSDYSNLGVGLLGDLIARRHDCTWEQLVIDRIAKPLHLDDTRVTLTDEQKKRLAPAYNGPASASYWRFDSLAGAGALYSTAADMLRFTQALAKPADTLLKAAIELIETPRADGSLGVCLQITHMPGGSNACWFAGGTGGFRSWISARPSDGRLVVMLINNSALEPTTVLAGKTPPPLTAGDPALNDYVGDYDTQVKAKGTSIHYTFTAHGGDLWMQITGQPAVKLERHPSTKDRFIFAPVKAEIQFTREASAITSTTLFQAGLEIKATKLP